MGWIGFCVWVLCERDLDLRERERVRVRVRERVRGVWEAAYALWVRLGMFGGY